MYLNHKYKYHVSLKCNNRKCNHTIKQLIHTDMDDPYSERLNVETVFSGHRFNLNTIIIAINLYYSHNLYLGDSDEWHADETVVKINRFNKY